MYMYGFFSNVMFELVIWMLYLQHIGWSIAEIALLQLVINWSQMFWELPSGFLADKIGRKNSIIFGQLLMLLYTAMYFIAEVHWAMYVGFFIFGLGLALISGSDQALIYTSLSAEKRTMYTKYYGVYNALAFAAVALGNVFGGFLQTIDWNWVFIGSVIFHGLSILMIMFTKERTNETPEDEDDDQIGVFASVIDFLKTNTQYKILIVIVALTQGTISLLYQYGSVYLKSFALTIPVISTSFGIIDGISAAVALTVYTLGKKFGVPKVIFNSLLLTLILILIPIVSQITWIVLLAFMLFNLLFEIWDTSLNNLMQDTIPDKSRATLLSFANLFTSFLMGLESLLIGHFNKFVNIQTIFISLGAVSITIALVLFIVYIKKETQNVQVQ